MKNAAWAALLINLVLAILGVLQGADWINLIGTSGAGWAVAILASLNTLAHAFTPAGPGMKQG